MVCPLSAPESRNFPQSTWAPSLDRLGLDAACVHSLAGKFTLHLSSNAESLRTSPETKRDPKGKLLPLSASPMTYLGCGLFCWSEGHHSVLFSWDTKGESYSLHYSLPGEADFVEKILGSDS